MSNWEYKSLELLGNISRGKSKHRPRDDERLFGGKYPFIQTSEIKKAEFYVSEYEKTYSDFGLAQSKLWPKGTLCITIAANIADTAILNMQACFPDSVMGFNAYEGVADNRFIKYAFDYLKDNMLLISQGTAQDNLSWKKLSTIKFPAPPYQIQKKIADMLSAYDNIIANNQKQIKLLEEAAQRLYKEWFIDLHFPGHEDCKIVDGVPEGWKQCKLGEVCHINQSQISNDYEYGYIDYVDIGSVNLGSINKITRYSLKDAPGRAKRLAKTGDVIWGMVRPNLKAYALVYEPPKTAVFSTGFAILSADSIPFSYLYELVTRNEFVAYLVNCTNGAAYPAVKPIHFEEADIILPTTSILNEFHRLTAGHYKKIHHLHKMIELAKEARDRLLPKLMSGEIEL